MNTGIELITEERQEQLIKHGRTIQGDVHFNTQNQLLSGIMMLASKVAFKRAGVEMPEEAVDDMIPEGWDREICLKMLGKSDIEQLKIIGAFAAAEIDRIQNVEVSDTTGDAQ